VGTPGNIYHYDFLTSSVDLKLAGTTYYGNGFALGGHQTALPALYANLEMVTVSTSYITSTLTIGAYYQSISSEWYAEDEVDFVSMIISPLSNCQYLLSNPSLVLYGFGLHFYPFVDTTDAFTLFDEFIAKTQYQLTMVTPQVDSAVFKSEGGLSGDLYTLDTYYSGKIDSTGSPSYELSFKIQFKCVYEHSTGVLKGMHYKVQNKGTFNGQSADITCDFLVEAYGYDLPDFGFGGLNFNITTDWWIIAAAGGGGLLIIIIIIIAVTISSKKKKSSKKTKKKSKKKSKK